MSTGPTAPITVTAPDPTTFNAAVAKLLTDVLNQTANYSNYENAEATLASVTADANASIQTATANVAAANDAQQAGAALLATDQQSVDAEMAKLLTPPVDPNAVTG